MKLQCMIVDDEPLAIELLETHIVAVNELELVATCENAIEATSQLRNTPVDLLFLDIQMPQLNGIEFVKTLKYKPKIIVTSAYQEYAYEAFQIDAIDYLLKPITFERFLASINKLFDKSRFHFTSQLTEIRASPQTFIYVKVNRKMRKVLLENVHYIESIRDYVKIKTKTENIIAQQKISIMEDKLPGDRFLRVHRSYIVSLPNIKSYSPTMIEIEKQNIPIGRSYKELVIKKLNELQ